MLQQWDSEKIGELVHLKFLLFTFSVCLLTVRCLWVPVRRVVACKHRDVYFYTPVVFVRILFSLTANKQFHSTDIWTFVLLKHVLGLFSAIVKASASRLNFIFAVNWKTFRALK